MSRKRSRELGQNALLDLGGAEGTAEDRWMLLIKVLEAQEERISILEHQIDTLHYTYVKRSPMNL